MNILIIEDERLSAEHLDTMVRKIIPDVQITGITDGVESTLRWMKKNAPPDLIISDIHLADGLSFEIFEQTTTETPVIFTTAYDTYAIRAFKLNSIDYLLKPVNPNDLKKALDKFSRHNQQPAPTTAEKINAVYAMMKPAFKTRFLVKSGDNIASISTDDIAVFTAEDGIVLLKSTNKSVYALDYSLDQLTELLSTEKFFRINRKVIVSLVTIDKISSYFNGRLKISSPFLKDEEAIVSRERVNAFKEWLDR